MEPAPEYDVFISYRRENGRDIARLLQQGLEKKGVRCFFDYNEISDGNFNEKIYDSIDSSKNFIILMTNDSLNRCINDNDWVRIEIERALAKGINIIPVVPSGHNRNFPQQLPASLESLRNLQISILNLEDFFEESISKLVDQRLKSVAQIDMEKAEETFLSRARRFKNNDGVIDAEEKKELENTAKELGIDIIRREWLIEKVEQEFLGKFQQNRHPIHHTPISTMPSDQRFQIVAGKEVSEADIEEAVGLDAISYPECYRGETTTCVNWSRANPDIYVMLRDTQTQKIVAYINAMPVTDECYEMIRNGAFIDVDISPEMILTYDMPCPYCLYFSSVVIHPDFRNSGLFKYLFNAILSRFLELGSNDVFIKKMLADAVSPEGEKFCKLFGMKKLDISEHGSSLYEVSMIPPEFRITSPMTKKLYDYYKQKYEDEPYLFD